jgi:integral membrane protein (TIGR01906 family)
MAAEPTNARRNTRFARLPTPLTAALLPVALLTSFIRMEMNSLGLYTRGFRVYDISSTTGLSENQLTEAAVRLIRYFNSLLQTPQMLVTHANGVQIELFHDYELIHLADVKVLFGINSVIQAWALLALTVLVLWGATLGHHAAVHRGLRYGAVATLVLLSLTGLAFLLEFNQMFVLFHLAAFDNPFWLLNPLTDYLVMLFPLGFWQDMFLFAGAGTGVTAGGILMATRLCPARPPVPGGGNQRSRSTDRDV